MQQLYSHWNQHDPYAGQMLNSPLMDEFSLAGAPTNPFVPLSYEEACDMADALDLPDGDWEFINRAYGLSE